MKKIEDNLLSVFNSMFREKNDWKYLTDKQKETYFFIINRNLSKKFPEKAQLLNLKTIDKVAAMDTWYYFMINKPYPNWFWSKGEKSEKSEIVDKDYKLLLQKLKIKDIDLDYLIINNIDYIKQELKYYKQLEKGN